MRKAKRLPEVGLIRAPPCGARCLTPVATEHGTTGKGEERRYRVAFAAVTTESRERSQDLEQRTRLWYHRSSSIKAFWLV